MDIDTKVIVRIKYYIEKHDISLSKLAKASKISYHNLWVILNQNYSIKLGDYVAICKALNEPLDFFLRGNITE